MLGNNRITQGVALMLACAFGSKVQAGNFDYEWFRIFGRWENGQLRADNIQLRLPDKNPNKGQISGQIDRIDHLGHFLIVGPFKVRWMEQTKFDKLTPQQLIAGKTVKISGVLSGNQFIAKSIALEATPYAPGSLQITGLSGRSFERRDGEHEFKLLDITVHTPQNGYNTFKSLIRRQDVRRPDDQFKFSLMGKPVTVGGEYDLNPTFRDGFDLDDKKQDGAVRLDQELKLEALYPISRFTAVFLSFKGITGSRFNFDEDAVDRTNLELARDETWIFFDRIAGTGFGLQLGNQNVSETREWWWDKDMDAIRLYYNRGSLHFELTGGKQLGGESTLQSIDQDDDEVYRVLGLASWMWRSKQRLEFFFLKQWDRSYQEHVGQVINKANRDAFDDNMAWFGARAIGEVGLDDYGSLNYWLDVAGVHGQETVYRYRSVNDLQTQVRSKSYNKVNGWAFDIGAFWTLPFAYEPTLTLSYARASGDSNPNDGDNTTFRQTGINRNKWRFNGVNRFRIYGELLRPDLSNLGIFTGAFGLRMLKNSSVELVYHKYDQVSAIDSMRDININQSPNGKSRDIGQEVDLVLNFREWKRWELGLTAAVFAPGMAFEQRDLAYSISLDINYNF